MTDAEKKLKARNKYINEWQKEKYYRLTVLIPKEQKGVLYNTACSKGFKNISDYIKALIDQDASGDTAALQGAKEPETITPEPIKDPYKCIDWGGEPLPFG